MDQCKHKHCNQSTKGSLYSLCNYHSEQWNTQIGWNRWDIEDYERFSNGEFDYLFVNQSPDFEPFKAHGNQAVINADADLIFMTDQTGNMMSFPLEEFSDWLLEQRLNDGM